MSARDKAIIDQLLARCEDLEEALGYAEAMLEMWESGDVQHDMSEVNDFWDKIKGRKQ